MFYGQYSGTIDNKNRISLPRGIRDTLTGDDIVLSRGFDEAIFGYDRMYWEEVSAKLLTSPLGDEAARNLRRTVFGNAFIAKVDDQGRFIVPHRLLGQAKLENGPLPVAMIGAGDHFEIWSSSTWEEYAKQLE